jgi:hypothetical protein
MTFDDCRAKIAGMVRPRYPYSAPKAFAPLSRAALSAAGVFERAETPAIVLERIAYGAGSTIWYCVRGTQLWTALTNRLRPRSLVSFYFDERIAKTVYDTSARTALETWWTRDGDAVLLTLVPNDIELDYWTIGGDTDLDDLEADGDLKPGDEIYIGPYPARDNDGTNAITVVLPDEDGVVRRHAY